jgi:hypothetical protein
MLKKVSNDMNKVIKLLHNPGNVTVTNFEQEQESQEYLAYRFTLGTSNIVFRKAKITPTKIGQFVTIWKRNSKGKTQAFEESDDIDMVIIVCVNGDQVGQYNFPKHALVEQRILSTENKKGKMGIRVYPPWDKPTSQQAINTQSWQLRYFIEKS